MENINFIPANQLPITDAKEVNVLCVADGTVKQKSSKDLGGASSWNDLKDKPFYSDVVEKEIKSNTVDAMDGTFLNDFPSFAIGDTVTLKVDGVEFSLEAYDDEGYITVGDKYTDLEAGTGQLGWQIYVNHEDPNRTIIFTSPTAHTIYWAVETIHKIDPKYLPEVGGSGGYDAIIKINSDDIADKTLVSGSYEAIRDKLAVGDYVNILLYVYRIPYNVKPQTIREVFFDEESYSIRVTFESTFTYLDNYVSIYSDGSLS